MHPSSAPIWHGCGTVRLGEGSTVVVVEVADVGPLPTLPPPSPGERMLLKLDGRPPAKTIGRSMRNPASPQRKRFMDLRQAAIEAMAGRKWYEGAVRVQLRYFNSEIPSMSALHPYL